MEEELRLKLSQPVSLDFSESQFVDHQRLSRALSSYIQAGIPAAQAATLLGLDVSMHTHGASPAGSRGLAWGTSRALSQARVRAVVGSRSL